jgi:hypothetical protein
LAPDGTTVCFVGRKPEDDAPRKWEFLCRGGTYAQAFEGAAARFHRVQVAAEVRKLAPGEIAAVASTLAPPHAIPAFHDSGEHSGIAARPNTRLPSRQLPGDARLSRKSTTVHKIPRVRPALVEARAAILAMRARRFA